MRLTSSSSSRFAIPFTTRRAAARDEPRHSDPTAVHTVPSSCREDPAADFVVVGAGAGGAVVATRLAEAGHRVVVVEAGTDAHPVETDVPGFHGVVSEDPAVSYDFGARHYADEVRAKSDPKYSAALGGVLYPRGKGIGGSTIINALVTVLPHKGDWDAIAEKLDDPSWSDAAMLRYWTERIENNHHRPLLRLRHRIGRALGIRALQNGRGHGFDGWLSVSQPPIKLLFSDPQFVKIVGRAALETERRLFSSSRSWFERFTEQVARLFTCFDPNDLHTIRRNGEGLTIIPISADPHGRRSSPRELLLAARERHGDHLEIRTDALVSRVLLDESQRATGVEILEGKHLYGADAEHASATGARRTELQARKGVILAGGAFGTPQILKLSGIGPKEELEPLGLDVRVDLPAVGENLHDRYEISVIDEVAKPFVSLERATFSARADDPYFQQWKRSGGGLYGTNGMLAGMILRSTPEIREPDLFIFGMPVPFKGYYEGWSRDATQDKDSFSWIILKAKTENRGGTLKLRSADPTEAPLIDFHNFDEGQTRDGQPTGRRDLDALLNAVDFVRHINGKLGGTFTRESVPNLGFEDRRDLEDWIKSNAWGHHATGSCALGTVLDRDLHVKGTKKLWVADASAFPDDPGYFIAAPTMMLAEKASDVILRETAEGLVRGAVEEAPGTPYPDNTRKKPSTLTT